MPRIKLKLRAKIHNLPLHDKLRGLRLRLRGHLLLPAAVALGLAPPLLCAGLLGLWQMLPAELAALLPTDARPLTYGALLTSPWLAGYALCRRCPNHPPTRGATAAFWLWLLGLALYAGVIGLPGIKSASEGLFAALALGVAGGMCAQRQMLRQKKKAEE